MTPDIEAEARAAFARFDLTRVPSPCFVVDEVALERNLAILADMAEASGAHILLALKAFSMHALAPLVSRHLSGTAASGLHEARLGREKFGGEVATFNAGFKRDELAQVLEISDHVIFNSASQRDRFRDLTDAKPGVEIGLRINPEHSEGWNPKYDPAAPCSRLGMPVSQLVGMDMDGLSGLHMHTLCEQNFAPLLRTWDAVEPKIARYLKDIRWMNLGGGHHITRADYDRDGLIALIRRIREDHGVEVYLEPGEAVALWSGILVGEVLDVADNGMPLAITDISATCHMPDVIEAPYRPDMLGESDVGTKYRLGGPSCLAGDVIGDYAPARPFTVGDRFAFLDQAHYSMVKTNTFNGVPLPAIAVWNSDTDALRIVRQFGFDDFATRLS